MLFATAVVFLALVGGRSNLSFMPAIWFHSRELWYLLGLVGFTAGFLLLRRPAEQETDAETPSASPAERETSFRRVVLYTRRGCPLCDEMKATLKRFRGQLPQLEEIDIDQDPQLREKFDTCVPVLEIDGTVRFRGRVSEILLRRLIEGASANSQ